MYDTSFGFLPRSFNPVQDPDDEIIYYEEEEVPEMYFCLEGLVSVGYFFGSSNTTKNEFRGVKRFAQMFIICDHYVVNNLRCEFVYMCIQPVKCSRALFFRLPWAPSKAFKVGRPDKRRRR